MGKRISALFRRSISAIKDHWLISMIVGALISWLLQWSLPSKAVDVRNLPHKELTCTVDYSSQMVTRDIFDGHLQVFYDGEEVKSPVINSITIENTGDRSILNEDFKEAFSIQLSGSKRIIRFYVTRSSDYSITEDVLADFSISGNILTINDFYLNIGESFTIHIVSDGKPDNIDCNSRISDIRMITTKSPQTGDKNSRIPIVTYSGVLIFLISALFIVIMKIVKTKD